jgi:hypothetical protein
MSYSGRTWCPADFRNLRLETPRLWLRPPRLEDFDALGDIHGRRGRLEIRRRQAGARQRLAAFMCMCGSWYMTGVAMFSVIEKSTGQWVGRLGPGAEGWPAPEVGWESRAPLGQGLRQRGRRRRDGSTPATCSAGTTHPLHPRKQRRLARRRRKLGSRNSAA